MGVPMREAAGSAHAHVGLTCQPAAVNVASVVPRVNGRALRLEARYDGRTRRLGRRGNDERARCSRPLIASTHWVNVKTAFWLRCSLQAFQTRAKR